MLCKFVLTFFLMAPAFSKAASTTLMVSIDRPSVSAQEVKAALEALNFKILDTSTGTMDCSASSGVAQFLGEEFFPNAPYYGVAIVRIESLCTIGVQRAILQIERDGRYTIYSNPGIDPTPAVSGRN